VIVLFLSAAFAQEPAPETPPEAPPADGAALPTDFPLLDERKPLWSGYGVPVFGANSIDGFGLGVAGEVFERPRSQEFGYRFKLSVSSWLTVSLNYISQYGQAEYRGRRHYLFRLGYQVWQNMPYAGVGGGDVSVDWGDAEGLNKIRGPYVMAAVSQPFSTHRKGYVQLYAHHLGVDPFADGLLDRADRFDETGGSYADVTVGLEWDDTDRWPMPLRGGRAEVDARVGGTLADGGPEPLFGAHGEIIRWTSDPHDRITLGGRFLVEKSFGERPFFEQFVTGGRWRDELGFDQAVVGYGRLRSRGDGVVAGMVEVRPHLVTVLPFGLELGVDASFFAEQAWLFDGNDPGPPLPSVGFGPDLLWQRGSQIRPFLVWGWWSDSPDDPRSPRMLYGISVQDPL
jgi:hypothetical protein